MRVVAVVILALFVALVVADDAAVLTADQKIAVKEARKKAIADIIAQQQQQTPESISKDPVFKFVGNDKPNTVDGASFVGKDGIKSIPITGASFVGKNGVRRIKNRLTKPIFSYVKSDTKVQSVVKRVSFKANANVKQLVTDVKPQLEQATGFEFAQTTPVSFTKKRVTDGTEYAVKVQIGDNKFTRVVIHKNKNEKIGRLRSAKLLPEAQVAKTMGAAAVLSEEMGAAAVLSAPVADTINFADLVAKTPKRRQRRGGKKNGKKNSKKTKNVKKAVNKTIKKSKKRANTLTRKLAAKPTAANAEKLKAIIAAIKKNYHKKAAAVRKAYHTTEDESARKVLANQYNKLTINVAKIVDKAQHRLKGAKFHRKTLAAVKEGKQVIKKSVNRLSKAFHKHGLKLPKSARPQFRKLQNKIKKAQQNGAKVMAVKNAERKMKFAAKLGIQRVFNKAHRFYKKSLVAVKKEANHAVLAVARSFKNVKAHARKHKKSSARTLSHKKHKKSPRKEHKKKHGKKHGKKHAKKCYKLKSPKKHGRKHRKSAF